MNLRPIVFLFTISSLASGSKNSHLPSFVWIEKANDDSGLAFLNIRFPDGKWDDYASLKQISGGKYNEEVSCIFFGHLHHENNVEVRVTGGCGQTLTFQVSFDSERLSFTAFDVKNGKVRAILQDLQPDEEIAHATLSNTISTVSFPPEGFLLRVKAFYDKSFKAKFETLSEIVVEKIFEKTNDVFKLPSLGTTFDVILTNIEEITETINADASYLKIVSSKYTSSSTIDAFIFFADEQSDDDKKQGIAYVQGLCSQNPNSNAAIVEWSESLSKTSLILAHEIGHLLGMRHDFNQAGKNKIKRKDLNREDCTDVYGIMDYTVDKKRWSTCSKEDFITYFAKVTSNSDSQRFCLLPGGSMSKQNSVGHWSNWKIEGKCNVTCGGGTQLLKRSCIDSLNKKSCLGSDEMPLDCNTQECTIDGNWGEWSTVSACSVSCGGGIQTQNRSCDNPAPSGGGFRCIGLNTQHIGCNMAPCPNAQEICLVVEAKSQTVKPCVFPFEYNNQVFNSCTTIDHSERWCSTKVDGMGKFVQGYWGNCGPTCFPVFTKVFVALGFNNSADVEIVDLKSLETTCQKPKDFPYVNYYAAGGLGFQDKPLICGGHYNISACHLYEDGVWKESFSLQEGRKSFKITMSPLQDGCSKLFATGGYGGSTFLNSSEVLTQNGWQAFNTLPIAIAGHCMVRVNSTSVMVIGGRQNGQRSGKSFIFNSESYIWTEGPTLNNERYYHNCGLIRKNIETQDKSLIVVGGRGSGPSKLRSVEVLDLDSYEWRKGADLPVTITETVMIEDPSGGVVLIGGQDDSGKSLDTLYRLRHAGSDATWELMPQKLLTKRHGHTAFLIPDHVATCK